MRFLESLLNPWRRARVLERSVSDLRDALDAQQRESIRLLGIVSDLRTERDSLLFRLNEERRVMRDLEERNRLLNEAIPKL